MINKYTSTPMILHTYSPLWYKLWYVYIGYTYTETLLLRTVNTEKYVKIRILNFVFVWKLRIETHRCKFVNVKQVRFGH